VMSSEQLLGSLGTEHWAMSEGEPRQESERKGIHRNKGNPNQRSDVSAARGAVQDREVSTEGQALSPQGQGPYIYCSGKSGDSIARSGGRAAATDREPRGGCGTADSGETSTRGKVMNAGDFREVSR
jgi:hypothetical protein